MRQQGLPESSISCGVVGVAARLVALGMNSNLPECDRACSLGQGLLHWKLKLRTARQTDSALRMGHWFLHCKLMFLHPVA